MANWIVAEKETIWKILKCVVAASFILAVSMTLLVYLLSTILYLTQVCMDVAGYKFVVSDEMAKAILTVVGAIAVALVALYGVRSQNLSAEKRHKIDSNLALKKDIFLQVAEAYSVNYQHLLSLVEPLTADDPRKTKLAGSSLAFFKLQLVAKEETIFAMVDANEEWARAIIDIGLMEKLSPDASAVARIGRLTEIHKRSVPFMEKLWRFNILARDEVESGFENPNLYLDEMGGKYMRVGAFFVELGQRIQAKNNGA